MLQTQKLITRETWRGWAGLLQAFTGIPAMPGWMSAGGGFSPLEYWRCHFPDCQPLPSHCPVTLSVWWHLSQSIWEFVCARVCMCVLHVYAFTHMHVCACVGRGIEVNPRFCSSGNMHPDLGTWNLLIKLGQLMSLSEEPTYPCLLGAVITSRDQQAPYPLSLLPSPTRHDQDFPFRISSIQLCWCILLMPEVETGGP